MPFRLSRCYISYTTKNNRFFRLQLEDLEPKDEIVNVPPEEVVAEKQTLLSKLHSFEKKELKEDITIATNDAPTVTKFAIIEPPKPPPKKVEVCSEGSFEITLYKKNYSISNRHRHTLVPTNEQLLFLKTKIA